MRPDARLLGGTSPKQDIRGDLPHKARQAVLEDGVCDPRHVLLPVHGHRHLPGHLLHKSRQQVWAGKVRVDTGRDVRDLAAGMHK